jgi:hypothetical protein
LPDEVVPEIRLKGVALQELEVSQLAFKPIRILEIALGELPLLAFNVTVYTVPLSLSGLQDAPKAVFKIVAF